jgi:hypothetical protein
LYSYISPKKLQKNIKQEREKAGEIRMHVKYTALKEKKEEKPKGIVLQGKWSKSTSGGTLNHGTWNVNPQYLLQIKEEVEVNIKLFQKEKQEVRMSFYLVKYNGNDP